MPRKRKSKVSLATYKMILQPQRLFKSLLCLLIGIQALGCYACAAVPAFVNESIYGSNKAKVSIIDSNLAADLVILDGGLNQGLRLGMVCLLERGAETIGELIIIESKSHCAAALILSLADESIIQSGDIARIKTLQNS